MHLAGLVSESMLLRAWRQWKGQDFAVTEHSVFVDSNNHLYVFARYVRQIYAHAKVVHVIRDPRTYVRSHLNWARERPKSFVANYLLPFWQPNGYLLGEFSLAQWLTLNSFQRFCWIWDFKNRYMAALENSNLPYLLIRFEDLTGGPCSQETLGTLREFLEVPVENSPEIACLPPLAHNATSLRRFPVWQQWSETRCKQLTTIVW